MKYDFTKRIGRKNLILSVVALILTIMMVVGSTYSWIENITAVQITNVPQGGTGADTATLGIKNDISETIVLGSCGPDDNDGSVSKFSAINLDSYFYESGDPHLTTCSGNGDSFMFKSLKGSANAKPWRIGTEDDENVNYLSATFKVCSPDAEVDMWFDEIPSVTSQGNTNTDSIARYSITVDGETNVYSASGTNYNHIKDADGNTTTATARKTAEYTYGNSQNVKDGKVNRNVLFRVGETPKEVTIRIWLQHTDGTNDYTDLKSDINMVLVSTWAKTRTITVRDCTSDCNSEYWMTSKDSPKLYVALASNPNAYHWDLTIDKDKREGTVNIPSYYYTGDEIYVFRIPATNNWGDDGYDGVIKVDVNGQQIPCWNYWKTALPKGFDDLVYNIVGNTPAIKDGDHTKQNDTGYSFWGEAEQITVTDNAGLNHGTDAVRMLVHDVDTHFYYPLYPSGNTWRGYIPRTSDKIEFLYRENTFPDNAINSINSISSGDKCYKNTAPDYRWGYNKSDATPQTRPYDDLTYTILSTTEGTWTELVNTKYRLAGFFNGSDSWNSDTVFKKEKGNDTLAFASITLNSDSLNQIKVMNAETGKYYSNDGVMCKVNSTNWSVTQDDKLPNIGLITGETTGTYKFWLNTETMKLTVEYPKGTTARRVYLVSNWDGYYKFAHMTNSGNNNGAYPGQKMDILGVIDRGQQYNSDQQRYKYVFSLEYPENLSPTKVKFSGQGNQNDTNSEKWQKEYDFDGSYALYTLVDQSQ